MSGLAERLHIGTSGWSYKEWKGLYYPEKLKSIQYLHFYSQEFKCVEVNSSFYHLPRAQTALNWALAVPESFRFCPKLSRCISHYQKLHDAADNLRLFFTIFDPIKDKLGPILIQLPAQVTFKREIAAPFFYLLKSGYPEYEFALEVRHESWLEPQSVELLQQYDISLVIAQSSKPFPYHELITAQHVYLRFHGPGNFTLPGMTMQRCYLMLKICYLAAGRTVRMGFFLIILFTGMRLRMHGYWSGIFWSVLRSSEGIHIVWKNASKRNA